MSELQPKGAFQPYQKKPNSDLTHVLPTLTPLPGPVDTQTNTQILDLKNNISINIIEGFTTSPQEKQNGGRDNKVPLRRHIVSVTLPQNAQARTYPCLILDQYLVLAKLIGKKNKVEYAEIEKLEQSGLRFTNGQWLCIFDRLIVQHASHNYGQKLFIRFTLVDGFTLTPLAYCDSASFETITRRGQESTGTHYLTFLERKRKDVASFTSLDPSICYNGHETLVKICGTGFTTTPTLNPSNVYIKFGNVVSKDVFSIQDDMIICQIPLLDFIGDAILEVSFDAGKKWFMTGLVLKVLNSPQEMKILPMMTTSQRLPSIQEMVEVPMKKTKMEDKQ